jgi:hypothetical protein
VVMAREALETGYEGCGKAPNHDCRHEGDAIITLAPFRVLPCRAVSRALELNAGEREATEGNVTGRNGGQEIWRSLGDCLLFFAR